MYCLLHIPTALHKLAQTAYALQVETNYWTKYCCAAYIRVNLIGRNGLKHCQAWSTHEPDLLELPRYLLYGLGMNCTPKGCCCCWEGCETICTRAHDPMLFPVRRWCLPHVSHTKFPAHIYYRISCCCSADICLHYYVSEQQFEHYCYLKIPLCVTKQ